MRIVLQRVSSAEVAVDDKVCGKIGGGLLAYIGVEDGDTADDIAYCAEKVVNLRIFEDEAGKMNRSILQNGGGILAISQFTLHGDVRRGRRPSFIKAAPPQAAQPLFDEFCAALRGYNIPVETGIFQAHMYVSSVNDGPVTILLDSKKLF